MWSRLGEVHTFVEPFAGGAAVFLAQPTPAPRIKVLGDADGLIANFYRAIRDDPCTVLLASERPKLEADLRAWQPELLKRREGLNTRLKDPQYYDAETAGVWWWWVSSTTAAFLRSTGLG